MTTLNVSVPVTPNGSGGLAAPDVTIPDVGTGDTVVITWFPDGDLQLTSITGLPSAVRMSGPTPTGDLIGTYFSPSSEDTWSYTIHGQIEGVYVKHDPQIHNTNPG
jgi:hypothetical protein